jgi:2,3-bisphosphoglycerate-dependent phosphoglycerate mutase
MATIYLFRHGQTDFNRDQKFTGWLDSHLTDLGRQQAQKVADSLGNKTIDYAYQTRLSRSQETLNIVLKTHPECKKIFTDDRIIERSYGDFAGETHQEVIDGLGIGQYEHWHRGFYDHPPGGESFADVEERVISFIADLKQRFTCQKLNIAISAHGNSIRLFRKIMENASIEETCSWVIPYDKFFQYEI